MALQDSGARREFSTGAVRDISDGSKGRTDLLPFMQVHHLMNDEMFYFIGEYLRTNDLEFIYDAIHLFIKKRYNRDYPTAMIELSRQYEDGALKYSPRNWQKGIDVHCFIDSGMRHYLKWLRGDDDENHDRAVLWNLIGAIWTSENRPSLIDIEFELNKKEKSIDEKTTNSV